MTDEQDELRKGQAKWPEPFDGLLLDCRSVENFKPNNGDIDRPRHLDQRAELGFKNLRLVFPLYVQLVWVFDVRSRHLKRTHLTAELKLR